jgi:hypothetical protein
MDPPTSLPAPLLPVWVAAAAALAVTGDPEVMIMAEAIVEGWAGVEVEGTEKAELERMEVEIPWDQRRFSSESEDRGGRDVPGQLRERGQQP